MATMAWGLALLVSTTTLAQQQSSIAPPLSPAEQVKTMQVKEGYSVIPVLTDPIIHEPSVIAWDGNGRMYVVEMRTYMQDIDGKEQLKPVSRVSRHEDTNGDGVYDKHTVFADNLALPRMVLPLLDRVIIRETNTLDLKSYQDTDDDGVADKIELWHEGGGRGGNLEHQPSGLIWNVDNWLYTTYSRHRYRVTPSGVVRQSLPHSGGQWGLTHDNVGRTFYSSAGGENPVTDFQQPIVYGRISLGGEQVGNFREVFPIDNVPDTQGGRGRLRANDTLNRFTASCGQSIFRGDRLPTDFHGDLIICEPVGRLIRRAKVTNDQGRLLVSNAYENSEFIASTDPNFRPVNSATGPDGCLYLVDMYRGIIQEGNWVRNGSYLRGVVQKFELDKNIGRGRIFRVQHESMKRSTKRPRMLEEKPAQLVAHLSHPNGWWRSEAQKLIVLHNDKSVVPALKQLAHSGEAPLGRLHAFWTLEGLEAIEPELLAAGFNDADPRVRAAAMRISEMFLDTERRLDAGVQKLASDEDPNVLIQVVLSVGRGGHPEADAIIAHILEANKENVAISGIAKQVQRQFAAMIADRKRLAEMRARNQALADAVVRGKLTYTTLCINCHGIDGKGVPSPDKKGQMLAPPLAGSPRVQGHKDRLLRIVLKGLIGPVDGKTYTGLMLPMQANDDKWVADVSTYIRNNFGNDGSLISSDDVKRIRAESSDRIGPWTLAELQSFDPPVLENRSSWKLTASHGGEKVQSAINGNLRDRWDTGTGQQPGMWFGIELPELVRVSSVVLDAQGSPDDYPRGYVVHVSSDGRDWGKPVAQGRGTQGIHAIEMSVPRPIKHIRITQTGSDRGKYWSIHDLAIKGISASAAPPMESLAKILAGMKPETLASEARKLGDAKRGAAIFYNQTLSCAKCHDPDSGKRLGPDLASKRDGVTDVFLVESILQPSKSIRKGFEQLVVQTDEGLVITGFRAHEDANTLVIRDPAAGKEIKLDKDDLLGMKTGELSAMPPGLVNQLADPKQFLDLAKFLMEINEGGAKRLSELK